MPQLFEVLINLFLLILIIVGIILFRLTRKFLLWYWKIDVRVRLLESIDKKMGVIINQGTNLDPKKIRKTINNPTTTNTHDHLL
tara:strand:+ start:300 stop:551 length:252 start_codon:yes stop_codon:yes gene_type:complete